MDIQELYYTLQSSRRELRSPFELPTSKPGESSQPTDPESKLVAATLSISASAAGSLLADARRSDPLLSAERRVDKALALYHSRRSTMIACWNILLQQSQRSDEDDEERIRNFVLDEVFGDGFSFAKVIVEELGRVKAGGLAMARLIIGARSATSLASNPPTLSRDSLLAVYKRIAVERTSLAFLLYEAARVHVLAPADIACLSDALANGIELDPQEVDVQPFFVCAILKALNPEVVGGEHFCMWGCIVLIVISSPRFLPSA